VYRVVTSIKDHRGGWILEKGPWLPSQNDAHQWAGILRNLGYKTHVETTSGEVLSGVQDFRRQASPLASS